MKSKLKKSIFFVNSSSKRRVSNRCKDLFKQKKYLGAMGTLTSAFSEKNIVACLDTQQPGSVLGFPRKNSSNPSLTCRFLFRNIK